MTRSCRAASRSCVVVRVLVLWIQCVFAVDAPLSSLLAVIFSIFLFLGEGRRGWAGCGVFLLLVVSWSSVGRQLVVFIVSTFRFRAGCAGLSTSEAEVTSTLQ
jgi:hypothetical protein